MQKKYIFYILIQLSISISSFGQNYFEFIDSSYNRQSVLGAFEFPENNYIISTRSSNYINLEYFTRLQQLNASGVVIDQLEISSDSINIRIYDFFESDFGFICIGAGNHNSESKGFIVFYEISNELEIVEEKFIYLSDLELSSIKARKSSSGDYLLVGNLGGLSVPFTAVLSEDGDLVQSNINHSFLNTVTDILEDDTSNGYLVYGNTRMYFLDSLFQYLSHETVPHAVGQQGNVIEFSEDKFLLTGKDFGGLGSDERDQYIGMLDYELNELTYTLIGKPDTFDYPAFFNSIDFINKNEIYYGGTSNLVILGSDPTNQEDLSFMLTKLDSSLNVIWTNYYGGTFNDQMYGIKATSDGGCLMYGWHYNGNSALRWAAYVLKVNGEGSLTFATEIPLSTPYNFFPNPTRGQFQLEGEDTGELEIQLATASGRSVYKRKIEANTPIQISHLPKGIYFYTLLDRDKRVVQVGKLIKAH